MRSRQLLAGLSACALILTGCAAKAAAPEAAPERAAVPVPGTNRVQVHITADAVRRLDLQTGTIRDESVAPRPTLAPAAAAPAAPGVAAAAEADVAKAAKPAKAAPVTAPPPPPAPPPPTAPPLRRVIPIGAVLYAASGEAFTYVNVAPELYERTPIAVEYAVGELAVLSAGPPPGTVVVTVGGPELSGAEFGVGE